MAFMIKEQVKSKDLVKGDYITKGHGHSFYKVQDIGLQVKISKITESMILGVPKEVFDGETWFKAEHIPDGPTLETIQRKSVQSSNLVSEGFHEPSQTLELEFSGGGVYRYAMVPKGLYERFLKSESKGRFFFSEIKGKFKHTKVK